MRVGAVQDCEYVVQFHRLKSKRKSRCTPGREGKKGIFAARKATCDVRIALRVLKMEYVSMAFFSHHPVGQRQWHVKAVQISRCCKQIEVFDKRRLLDTAPIVL